GDHLPDARNMSLEEIKKVRREVFGSHACENGATPDSLLPFSGGSLDDLPGPSSAARPSSGGRRPAPAPRRGRSFRPSAAAAFRALLPCLVLVLALSSWPSPPPP
ncbi:unnamed protein product, partial [Prorocentrum cordatum]